MRRRFVHKTSAESPKKKYRIRNRFSYKDKDTAALPSITTSSRQNNTRTSTLSPEDDNTRISTPSPEDDNIRASTFSPEDDNTRTSTPSPEDDNTRISTPSPEDDNIRASTFSPEDDNTRTSTPSPEDDNTRTSTPSSEDDSMEFRHDYEYDDMEFQYDYEYDDMEFQYNFEYDNMDSHYEYDDIEVEEEEENVEERRQIVDEALSGDKMSNNGSELAPYFENLTAASLFCWLQKHNISTNAYEDLADILHNTNFNPTHVVKNVRRFQKWRERLPLLPISARTISISSKKTPSTFKDSKTAYQLSISDIIYYVLNNPSMFMHMYFGPGIYSETKSEYWHGTLWEI